MTPEAKQTMLATNGVGSSDMPVLNGASTPATLNSAEDVEKMTARLKQQVSLRE